MHYALLTPFFFLERVIVIENISYKEYLSALENKEIVRKAILDIRFQININKFNPKVLNELTPKEQRLLSEMRKNIFIIKMYENKNNLEGEKENDQHKGK